MLGSIERLTGQVSEVAAAAKDLVIPADYKKVQSIVLLGMGGSTLGTFIVKSLYQRELKLPLEICNDYHIPAYVDEKSLVIVSSYSGDTEEALSAMKEAVTKRAKLLAITSGGELSRQARQYKFPALVYAIKNNPCDSPRMGLGYAVVGQMLLLSKAGLLKFGDKEIKEIIRAVSRCGKLFGPAAPASANAAKRLALALADKSAWFVASEHLTHNAHTAANQMNENAKRFAGYFTIPELNHHLLEGMNYPASNARDLLFVLIQSALYDKRVQKRYTITKKIMEKHHVECFDYKCLEKNRLAQVFEVLVFSSYASFYSALLAGVDPTEIPFVDFFKAELKK